MPTPYDKIVNGRDFNFFQKVTVTSATFQDNCDTLITFPTSGFTLNLIGTGVVQYSFNGNTVHGEMDSSNSSKDLKFDNRRVSKIWFKLISGSGTVRIEAWSNS